MYKKLLWTIALSSALTYNQLSIAETSICREGLDKMVQSLNLTDDQKAKAKPVLDQLKSDLQNAGSQMGSLESQINQQSSSANIDQNQVNSLIDKKAQLIGDMMKAKARAKNQIVTILNSEQKQKLQDMISKEDAKMAALYKDCDKD